LKIINLVGKYYLQLKTMVAKQVQVESDIPIENISHVSTPHQSPLQTILVVNDIDYYK